MTTTDRPIPSPEVERAFQTWLPSAHSGALGRRTADSHAAFFMPHLRPGMRLLDAGCGPGSITVGLARAVSPAEVVGIDTDAAAIDAARTAARASGATNVQFEVYDIHRLPFGPEFDAVFCHAVLQHVPDPVRTLRALSRVMKPGAVIGVADADYDGSIIAPRSRVLARALRLSLRVRQSRGGDLQIGRSLRRYLAEAGFEGAAASATANTVGAAASAGLTAEWQARYLEAPEFARYVVANGWTDTTALADMAGAWRAWGSNPGAYWATFWCNAVAHSPSA
ncbi:MAG: class I SAM-dependent methyltransferase [Dehalococcoidia bacterium]